VPRPSLYADIFWDPICAWCLIGHARLKKAAASYRDEGLDLRIRWRSFPLNPSMPKAGMDRQLYLSRKFGSKLRADQIFAEIAEVAQADGLSFNPEAIRRTPNTSDAHRLVAEASKQGRADALVEAIFSAYFTRGEDIGQAGILLSCAREAGLDMTQAQSLISSDAQLAEIMNEAREARVRGLSSLPCIIIANRYLLAGAQSHLAIQRIFDLALNQPQPT
jgi:predicted DsbA family dithiol-disulfide isomerase